MPILFQLQLAWAVEELHATVPLMHFSITGASAQTARGSTNRPKNPAVLALATVPLILWWFVASRGVVIAER